jgi:hypothetical protein
MYSHSIDFDTSAIADEANREVNDSHPYPQPLGSTLNTATCNDPPRATRLRFKHCTNSTGICSDKRYESNQPSFVLQ